MQALRRKIHDDGQEQLLEVVADCYSIQEYGT
jgi:hypothetical protein